MPTCEKSHQQSTRSSLDLNNINSQQESSTSQSTMFLQQPTNSTATTNTTQQQQQHQANDNKSCSGQSSLSSCNSSDTESRLLNSNADYDHIRNTTLMFFLDRLYIASKDGKEARTLHDLSCLFGTKDFTKEMRQIVGASRNGLKKFLQSYPSLFTIEGDKVYLTQLKQDSNQSVRDYNKEAVEYFTQKLLQFGASLVPIRNLFGYRSQASQEVRHVSGKNTKEFKQFLSAHEDIFELLDDEHIVLKSAFKELKSKDEFNEILQKTIQTPLNHDDVVVMDPYLNKQFAHLIEDIMKKMQLNENVSSIQSDLEDDDNKKSTTNNKTITIENLHSKIMNDCNNQLFLNMVKTIEDLKVFLRMHPKLFKRFKCDQDNKEYVCLLTEEERRELELQSFPSLIARQHSTLKRIDTNESNISSLIDQPMSLPISSLDQDTNHRQPYSIKDQSTSKNLSFTIESKSHELGAAKNQASLSPPSSSLANNDKGHSSLRATAPPFVPSTYNQQQQPASLQHSTSNNQHIISKTIPSNQQTIKPMQRSVSNLTTSNATPNQRPSIIDPRSAVRSYLLKASAENNSMNQHGPFKHPNVLKSTIPSNFHHQASQQLSRQSSSVNDDLKARTVNIVREASNIIARIMSTTDAVALDCKGYNLGFNGQITMIQFGFLPNTMISSTCHENNNNNQQPKHKPEVCIFDLITNPELAYCLKPLLESESIVKIVHDVRNKSNLLYSQFEIMLNHVFDTQVANLVIQQQETGKPAYKSRYISMNRLCEIYGDESLMKYRNLIKTKHSGNNQNSNINLTSNNKTKDVNYWRIRPLTDAMVYESTMDVYCLVGGVYQNLKSKIKPEYKPLFEQLNLEGVLARIKPDEIRSVKKERKIDLEVIDLKRKLYSDTTGLIVLSNREIRLLRHIDLTEEVRRKIQQCKKVAKKLERLDMKAAQHNQSMLQSMNNNNSNRNSIDGDKPMDAQTSGSGSLSSSNQNGESVDEFGNIDSNADDKEGQKNPELTEMGMNDLMDSSMFDELKDKMIESSNLLESLENDDDGGEFNQMADSHMKQQLTSLPSVATSGEHSEHEFGSSHDSCRCNCHRNSSSDDSNEKTSELPENPTSKTHDTSISSSTKLDKSEEGSIGSRVVDMAIQCDLLS